MKPSFSRRNVLRGAGGATLALPFLASAPGWRTARAQVAPTKRMIFVYLAQNEIEDFMPKGGDTSLSLDGTYLAPFAPYTNKMIVLHNTRGTTGHHQGHSEWLTGFVNLETYRPLGGPSIDQLMAERLRGKTALPSLELTVAGKAMAARDQAVLAWTKDRLPIPAMHEPLDAFNRVFGNSLPTGPASERARMLSMSLLDGLMEDYRQLATRLDAGDRKLLDAHLELLRDNERRLKAVAVSTNCGRDRAAPPKANAPDQSEGDIPFKMTHYADIITAAMKCDITRVVTLGMGFSHDQIRYPFAGCAENFHLVAHETIDNPERCRQLHFKVREWQAKQIARICEGLEATPSPRGGTLLDETSVVWLPELGYRPIAQRGNTHLRNNTPAVIIGGCGAFFRTNRLVNAGGRDYGDLLLTFVHAMGYEDVKAVGNRSTGPLTALRA